VKSKDRKVARSSSHMTAQGPAQATTSSGRAITTANVFAGVLRLSNEIESFFVGRNPTSKAFFLGVGEELKSEDYEAEVERERTKSEEKGTGKSQT